MAVSTEIDRPSQPHKSMPMLEMPMFEEMRLQDEEQFEGRIQKETLERTKAQAAAACE